MHIGRSHHPLADTIGSIIGGFGISFLVFTGQVMMQSSKNFRGQLLAGDPAANRDLPTTLNAMRSIQDGSSPILQAMSSYAWWVAVLIGAAIASVILLKLLRRYA